MRVRTRRRKWSLATGLATLLTVAACTGGSPSHRATIDVGPQPSRLTQPVSIRVSGLAADSVCTVQLSSTDAHGTRWASSARFRSTRDGTIELDRARSLGGSYSGVNQMGLLETLAPRSQPQAGAERLYWWSGVQRFRVTVRPEGGEPVARATFRRQVGPGVRSTTQTVAGEGFDGVFYRGPGGSTGKRRPAILAFGGSEGGNSMSLAGNALAASGYPTLTLAYFHAPGLPEHLVKIPLEYFAEALRWLAGQPGVDPHRIYILGASRGSEAAQLVAVHYPKLVYGVVLGVPSGVVQVGLTGGTGLSSRPAGASAWSFHGKPVPYAVHVNEPHPTAVPRSVIPVERIPGPMFLVCGGSDQVWASCPFSRAIVERLTAHHDRFAHVLAAYPDAGHGVGSLVPYEPAAAAADSVTAGRQPGANQLALAKVWPRLIQFLHTTATHPR